MVAQVLKLFQLSSNPEQPGLDSFRSRSHLKPTSVCAFLCFFFFFAHRNVVVAWDIIPYRAAAQKVGSVKNNLLQVVSNLEPVQILLGGWYPVILPVRSGMEQKVLR